MCVKVQLPSSFEAVLIRSISQLEAQGGGSVLGVPQPPPDPSISTHSHPCLFQPDPSLDPESLLQPHVMDSAVTGPSPLRKLSTRRGCWRGCQDCPVRPLLRASSPFATPAGWFGARHTHTPSSPHPAPCSRTSPTLSLLRLTLLQAQALAQAAHMLGYVPLTPSFLPADRLVLSSNTISLGSPP